MEATKILKIKMNRENANFYEKMDGTTEQTVRFLNKYLREHNLSVQKLLSRDENPKISYQSAYEILNGTTKKPAHDSLNYLLSLTGHKYFIGIDFQADLNDDEK